MSYAIEKKRVPPAESSAWLEAADEELLRRYCERGDRQAFTVLVHRYERELYSYLRRYLGDSAMAEDAFQATFLQLHLKCDQFEEGRKVRPWLYTIATNQAIDAQRRNKRHRLVSLDRRNTHENKDDLGTLIELLVSKETGPVAQLEADERQTWVRKAIQELPEPLSNAVNLIYYQGLKYREAAEILDVPVGTVKSRLHTAILKLNEAWNGAGLSGEN
ncbi:MAG TPA: sigma-70 family RNA polymerase sigma factor [Pirellulales bacterium]|nr:sigma-70 family RNA polymerase sigma factor [Pirellulales bacterium]